MNGQGFHQVYDIQPKKLNNAYIDIFNNKIEYEDIYDSENSSDIDGYDNFENHKHVGHTNLNSNFNHPNFSPHSVELGDINLDSLFENDPTNFNLNERGDLRLHEPSTREESMFYSMSGVEPPYLMVMEGIPSKSRVETQIRMTLKFLEEDGSICRRYKRIFMDENQIDFCSMKKKRNLSSDEELVVGKLYPHLILECYVVKSTDISQNVYRCDRCTERESKSLKKKLKGKSEMYIYECMQALEKNSILKFHTGIMVDIKEGVCVLPFRITCYCRHHKESNGFVIRLRFIDGCTNTVVMEASSPSILMTDNRKQFSTNKKRKRNESNDSSTLSPCSNDSSSLISSPCDDVLYSTIEKIIPNEGSLSGGTEVTMLGKNFTPLQEFYFGGLKGEVLQFWNSSTIVCKIPPSKCPGPVVVALSNSQTQDSDGPVFTYIDEKKIKTMEMALQIIEMQRTGRLLDANKIAHSIVRQAMPNN